MLNPALNRAPWLSTGAPPDRQLARFVAWQIVRAVALQPTFLLPPTLLGRHGRCVRARRADGTFEGRAAIELLKRGMDSAAVLGRFASERQALARLSHPSIARLLDAGASDDGPPYFVIAFVAGVPLDEAVRGLTIEARLGLFLQLTDAVAHAHRNLLVHRDLKPGNVLVTAEGEVKLLDFGSAKALDPLDGSDASDSDTTLGGMRQRVSIARALAVDPEVLLMDEPFAALDAQNRALMQREMGRLLAEADVATRKTMVLVTHSIEEAILLSDHIVVLSARPGRVREVVPVELLRPRDEDDPRFIALRRHLRTLINEETAERTAPAS